jgi:hypothetical protein
MTYITIIFIILGIVGLIFIYKITKDTNIDSLGIIFYYCLFAITIFG